MKGIGVLWRFRIIKIVLFQNHKADDSHELSSLIFSEKNNNKQIKITSTAVVIGILRVNRSLVNDSHNHDFVSLLFWTLFILSSLMIDWLC